MQVMHGGLFSEDNVTLDDIRKVDRNRQPPETGRSHRNVNFVRNVNFFRSDVVNLKQDLSL